MTAADQSSPEKEELTRSVSVSRAMQKCFQMGHAAVSRGQGMLRRQRSIKVVENQLNSWAVEGVSRSLTDDFAHLCLEMHWSRLLPFILGFYVVISLIFALLLYLTDAGTSIGGDIPPSMSSFEVCWWFSTVNLVTAGFGAMVPTGRHAYVVSTAAHLVGLLLNSLLLGIVVAKASLPTAKMVFSNVVCVRTRNGVQHLMVRVGNARGNILYSPDIRLAYIRAVETSEGEVYFADVQLQVKVPVALQPVFMISHAVTEDSPLNGKTQADILKERGFFILIVSAAEVETGQALYARRMYFMKDFLFNHQFVDVVAGGNVPSKPGSREAMEQSMRQERVIDFLKFHDSVPLPQHASTKPLQQNNPAFGAPQSLRSSSQSLRSISPTAEEAETPSAARSNQAKQMFSSRHVDRPEPKVIGVQAHTSSGLTALEMQPPSGPLGRDPSAARPIGQASIGQTRASSTGPAPKSLPPSFTRPSFDQAQATFEKFLRTPFASALPKVAENSTQDARLGVGHVPARTRSGPGANLGVYKPIFQEEAQERDEAEGSPSRSSKSSKSSTERRNSTARRSFDVSPGKPHPSAPDGAL